MAEVYENQNETMLTSFKHYKFHLRISHSKYECKIYMGSLVWTFT